MAPPIQATTPLLGPAVRHRATIPRYGGVTQTPPLLATLDVVAPWRGLPPVDGRSALEIRLR
jgi:hypothetical protein